MSSQAATAPVLRSSLLDAELPRHVLTGFMRYEGFEQLGLGGKSEVFRCVDKTLGREVAFKLLHESLMESPVEQQMLVREARIMARLNHASIPKVYDLGRDSHARPYFAMTFVEGRTLHDVLSTLREGAEQAGAHYTLERLVALLVQACDMLRYAHEMNVLHCDVKPENFILDTGDRLHLIDWGLATLIDRPEEEADGIDTSWGRQGSPLYMSPEQVNRAPHLGPPTDVYSLGTVLYEALTLRTPFHGPTVDDTLRLVADEDPIPPRDVAPQRGVSRELEQVCLRAIAKDVQDRFATVAEFGAALRDCHLDLLVDFERDDPRTTTVR